MRSKHSQPQKPLGFALGWYFILTCPVRGLLFLYQGLDTYPTRIRLYLTFSGMNSWEKVIIALSMIAENLLLILLGVLNFVSAHGLVGKKQYGYYLTQVALILNIVWLIWPVNKYFVFYGEASKNGIINAYAWVGILIDLLLISYFENRKHMFVPEVGEHQHA